MSEENVELLRRAWAAYDVGDIEGFAACLTDDWREYDSAAFRGIEIGSDPLGHQRICDSHQGHLPSDIRAS